MKINFNIDVELEVSTDEMRTLFEMEREYERQRRQDDRNRRRERRREDRKNRHNKDVVDVPYKEK